MNTTFFFGLLRITFWRQFFFSTWLQRVTEHWTLKAIRMRMRKSKVKGKSDVELIVALQPVYLNSWTCLIRFSHRLIQIYTHIYTQTICSSQRTQRFNLNLFSFSAGYAGNAFSLFNWFMLHSNLIRDDLSIMPLKSKTSVLKHCHRVRSITCGKRAWMALDSTSNCIKCDPIFYIRPIFLY